MFKYWTLHSIYNFKPGPFKYGAVLSNGHLAFDKNSRLSIKLILKRSIPAQAIIAALSLHKLVGGNIGIKFFSLDKFFKFSLIDKFDATPPAITKIFFFCCCPPDYN